MIEHKRTGFIDRINHRISRFTMLLPAFVVAIMFYEVFMRYVLGKPTLWVNEMSLWVAGIIYLTAGLYAMQQRSHIRITLFYDMSPRWLQRIFDVISVSCIVLFTAATVWGGFGEAYAKLMRWETFGTAWDPPIPATMKPLILLTLVIMSLQAISNLVKDWNKEPEVHNVPDEIDLDVIKASAKSAIKD